MFNDFDVPEDDFGFSKSPVSSPPRLGLDFSIESTDFDSTSFNFGLELDDEITCFSQPIDEIRDIPVKTFGLEIAPRPKVAPKPAIFKPFSSFESLEMTVKGLREHLSKEIRRTYSMPVADMP